MIKFNLKELFWITKTAEFSETLPPPSPVLPPRLYLEHTGGGGGGGGETAGGPLDPPLFF